MLVEDTTKIQKFFENSNSKGKISPQRKALLISIAEKTHNVLFHTNSTIHLNFICTHNSRCSQMAQIWAHYAAHYFEIQDVKTYSGGTSVTSIHRNTIIALQKAGFQIDIATLNHQNSKYLIHFNEQIAPLCVYSKLYDDDHNSEPCISITTCRHAEEVSPFVSGAIWRFFLPYATPKKFDNSKKEEKAYVILNQQIASEIFFLFNELKKLHIPIKQ